MCHLLAGRSSTAHPASLRQHRLGQEQRTPLDSSQAVVPVTALKLKPPIGLAHQSRLAKQRHHPAGVQHDPGAFSARQLHAEALPSGLGSASVVHSRIRANHQLATCSGALRSIRERRLATRPPSEFPSCSSICPRTVVSCLSIVLMFVEVLRRQWQQRGRA